MKGSLTERAPGVWTLRVYTGRRRTNGSPIMATKTFRGGKRAAQSALAAFVSATAADDIRHTPGTMGELLDRWLKTLGPPRHSAGTTVEYRRLVAKAIKPALGNIRLDRLGPAQLDATYAAWLAAGLAPSSVRRRHTVISSALTQGVRWGWIAANPAARARPPGLANQQLMIPTADEVRALIALAEARGNYVLASAILLAALTGARRGELCALRWSDIDLVGTRLTIRRSLTVLKGAKLIEGPTKTHQVRTLALDPLGVEVLRRLAENQRVVAEAAGVALVANPWVLSRSGAGGLPCLPAGLSLAFRRLCVRAGLTTGPPNDPKARYHFHQLRHFAATLAISSGHNARSVASRLGHADPSMTLRVYAHALEADDRQIAAELGRALSP